jgi:cysteinyl-tRNA synthetase
MNEEFKYRIVAAAEDFNNAIIEKSNVKVMFTMKEINDDTARLAKLKKELEGGLNLRNAEMSNIEHFHPEVKTATEDDVFKAQTLAMYTDKRKEAEKITSKLAEVAEAEKEIAKTIADIEAQIGIPVNVTELNA